MDGDRSAAGAGRELELSGAPLAPGGFLVFDDLILCGTGLAAGWEVVPRRHPDGQFIDNLRDHNGTGIAYRPPG